MQDVSPDPNKFQDLDSKDPTSTPSNRAMAFAAEHGLFVTTGDDTMLLIDLDSEAGKSQFFETWEHMMTGHEIQYKSVLWTASRSGGAHVVVVLKEPMDIMERLLLQACLGSDLTRERISRWRVHQGDSCPTLLIDLPDAAWRHLASLKEYKITKGIKDEPSTRIDSPGSGRRVPIRHKGPTRTPVDRLIKKKAR